MFNLTESELATIIATFAACCDDAGTVHDLQDVVGTKQLAQEAMNLYKDLFHKYGSDIFTVDLRIKNNAEV